MVDDSIPRIILILVLILFAAVFAGTEIAYSSCNRIRIKMLADDGDRRASRVIWILSQFDRALITLLIGVNVIHVAASSLSTVLVVSWIGPSGSVVSTVVLTLLIFMFGEIIPKNIARTNADSFAMLVSAPLRLLIIALTPVEWFFIKLSDFAKKLFGTKKAPSMTEDEFSSIIETVEEEGVIDAEESMMIRSAIEFSDLKASDVMIPVDNVIAINKNIEDEDLQEIIINGKYTRFPVYEGSVDRVIGILNTRDYLFDLMHNQQKNVQKYLLAPYYVSPDTKINMIFEEMSRRRTHMAIVGSRSKSVLGILTMEDILEEIVGEIYDEFDDKPEFFEERGDRA